MQPYRIALFGETEKGEYHAAYFCTQLEELVDYFGQAPVNSQGLHYAVQALLYHHELIFFRVQEEGFSLEDYLFGVRLLEKQAIISQISAICIPGVGNREIIQATLALCAIYHSIIITTEADLYDYLTAS
ncbi:MAG: hypothetical protein ACXU9U_02540 [Parachlamydiaceae bacterium]